MAMPEGISAPRWSIRATAVVRPTAGRSVRGGDDVADQGERQHDHGATATATATASTVRGAGGQELRQISCDAVRDGGDVGDAGGGEVEAPRPYMSLSLPRSGVTVTG
ncbi:hypothetical protein ACFVDQ_37235 [Streptomyces sp. NPDC057684]|uniref:hypothetical protein n=1 Tax=Streptomyces sp. NPDC057684 TaxID=3346211 RepID=UPI0036C9E767